MDKEAIIKQFKDLGYELSQPISQPGILTASNRLNRRYLITFEDNEQQFGLEWDRTIGCFSSKGWIHGRYEVIVSRIAPGLATVMVSARISTPEEIGLLYPKLQTILQCMDTTDWVN